MNLPMNAIECNQTVFADYHHYECVPTYQFHTVITIIRKNDLLA